jgi:hypothetical protein
MGSSNAQVAGPSYVHSFQKHHYGCHDRGSSNVEVIKVVRKDNPGNDLRPCVVDLAVVDGLVSTGHQFDSNANRDIGEDRFETCYLRQEYLERCTESLCG